MKVNSSNISEIEHDDGLLTVTFTSGRTYVYEGVPEGVYTALVDESKAPGGSVGKTFNRLVRGGGYEGVEQS
jgi:hypothetical protein